MHQYIMLMGAMQVVQHVRGYNMLSSSAAGGSGSSKIGGRRPHPAGASNSTGGNEVVTFWHRDVGSDVSLSKYD